MSLNDKILERLRHGQTVSGESLAAELGVSRAAVWKSIRSLTKAGYAIESLMGKGYRLDIGDGITEQDIRAYLGEGSPISAVYSFDSIDSTNNRAKEIALTAPRGSNALVIADTQTGGKGRRGRSFVSPRGKGIYMSLLCYPDGSADRAVAITAFAAVAACRVIERMCGVSPKIKWVNDIFLGGRKIAGILTEGSVNMEEGCFDYAVIGIGINVRRTDFGDLSDIATDIESEIGVCLNRAELAAGIAEEMLRGIATVGSPEVAEEYRRRQLVIGRRVRVLKPTEEYTATVLGVTDSCELHLRLDNGKEELLATGEVSLKMND